MIRSSAELVVLALCLSGCTGLEKLALDLGLAGPPSTDPKEVHPVEGATTSHEAFTWVLDSVVDDRGYVDYEKLAAEPEALDAYIASLEVLDFDALARDHKLATLINAYNACTLRLIVDHLPLASIKDIPEADRWKAERWNLAGQVLSLDDIEHRRIRQNFIEPRIHFAVNCASIGCPALADTAYEGATLDADLERASQRVHDPGQRWFEVSDGDSSRVRVTRLYLWYAPDFRRVAGTVEAFVRRYHDVPGDEEPSLSYLDYDWSLNRSQ